MVTLPDRIEVLIVPMDLVTVGGLEVLDEVVEDVEELGGGLVAQSRRSFGEFVVDHGDHRGRGGRGFAAAVVFGSANTSK